MKKAFTSLVLLLIITSVFSQVVYTFTNCSNIGRFGPSQNQINSTYSGTTLEGQVTSNNGIQQWTVPGAGNYTIEVYGAQGGRPSGVSNDDRGKGAYLRGDFDLSDNQLLNIIVGQSGKVNSGGDYANGGGSGGGGSFVFLSEETLLIAASGGGGASIENTNYNPEYCLGRGGTTELDGLPSWSNVQNQGTNGNSATTSNGAKGWYEMSQSLDFSGNSSNGYGDECGFGGGGDGIDAHGAGGGGGYSGGGSSQYNVNSGSGNPDGRNGGGGGGSYNSGTNQDNQSGIRDDEGLVVITFNGIIPDFISSETNVYLEQELQFFDASIGNPTTWEWDFENDGIYDSFIQDPTHIYNTEGNYNVKLKISNGTLVDSLIKINFISVTYCPPASPQNVNVEISGDDAIISWTAVDTTDCGSTITPDGYIVKFNEIADQEYFWFLAFTTNTTHTHEFVVQYSPQMFYEIIAIKNFSREQIEYLESLNISPEKIKWVDVKQNLKKISYIK